MELKRHVKNFKNKNVLLLQSPIGPYFRRLASLMKKENANVFKINFNGGDRFFYPFNATTYKGNFNHFRYFFKDFCVQNKIQAVVLFNDCRPVHRIAIKIAKRLKIDVFIFEEGYLRPSFITLEKNGVNANSPIPREKSFYLGKDFIVKDEHKNIKGAFKYMAFYAFLYWFFAFLLSAFHNNSLHHRSLSPLELLPWIRSLFRKILYKFSEKNINKKIQKDLKNSYFIAILQVYNDTQVSRHYKYKSVEVFIRKTIASFANNARSKHYLIFKHHPMDRGYKNYAKLIESLSKQYNISDRVIYVHDSHLPTVLSNALGCVVINSTVGLSALYHNCPLKVCGEAFYNIDGITYQKSLDLFWRQAHSYKPNYRMYANLRAYLLINNQINSNFYKNKL